MLKQSIKIIEDMQYPSGLFAASNPNVKTGYNLSWIRDNVYTLIGLESAQKYNLVRKTLRALLEILLKHENKIDWAIKEKPKHAYQYIHARYNPNSMEEIWESWGNKQNDAIGALLFKIGDLEENGIKIIRNENDLRIIQKLVNYLESIEYWHDKDNGMWEENEEIHASSIGACVAGLKKIRKIVHVKNELIKIGQEELNKLLPRESETKEVDLALLSLIYPYNITTKEQRNLILKNVEDKLLRDKGVLRYLGDQYYFRNGEAQWTMGLPWLAIIYKKLNMPDKYAFYSRKTLEAMNERGELPELYYADSNEHNENCPLAWSQALFVASLEE
ncbi:MAG TPA: glycoside hydrolase family 15 protein [Candidatus Nanoarchaeia archaeon]|nr:glycoside hydrolase family 15 protein [Candidatus Nanoarchaeia archaeon]